MKSGISTASLTLPWRFVDGAESLGSELAKGAFDPERAAQLISHVARAVAYAHQRGVIHRDLKPANILLDREDRPCLVDFGLAKLFGSTASFTESQTNLSDDGKLIGTPYYMSPEQIQGGDLTTATDVYSLGVVLYELLSGSPPFKSRSLHGMLDDITHLPPGPLVTRERKVPKDLEVICFKCLRKQPGNRYPTADTLADDLDRWLNQMPIHARPSSKRDRIAKWARRHPGVAVLSPVVAVLAMVAMGLFYWLWRDTSNRNEESVLGPLAEATLQRTSANKRAGRRWMAIDSLKLATSNLSVLRDKRREDYRKKLQNEALACLSLIDLRPSEDHADSWEGDPDETGLTRLSADFSIYAHSTKDHQVVIRDRVSNNVLLTFAAPVEGGCVSIRFDAEGHRLAAVFDGRSGDEEANSDTSFQLVVWDIASELLVWRGSTNGPDSFDFAADGARIAVGVGDVIRLQSLEPAAEVSAQELKMPFTAATVRLDHKSELIAARPSMESGSGVIVAMVESGRQFVFQGSRVLDMEWNPRGRWLALGCDDGRVIVWDTEAEGESRFRELPPWSGGQSAIENLAWHPRGVLIAGTSSAGKVHLWHVSKGELEVTWSGDGSLHQPQFYQDSTGGSRLGPVIDGSEVFLLEVAEGRIVSHARGHPGKIFGAWWRDSGRVFATSGNDGVRIWNRSGFELAFIPEAEARAAIFTDQGLVITGRRGVSIRPVIGGGSNPVASSIRIGGPRRFDADLPCLDAAYDSVHQRLAVATSGSVRIYDLSDAAGAGSTSSPLIKELDAPPRTAFVDFSRDGEWLACGTEGGSGVKLWQAGDNWQPVSASFPVAGSADVTFYHDPTPAELLPVPEHSFVTGGIREYRFYDIGSWRYRKSIATDLGDEMGTIAFSPRTPVFAVSEGGWIRIYGLHGFERLISPEFDSQEPVCFSPGGEIIITADRAAKNTHLHMWDLRLLRAELASLDLDLYLRPFPKEPTPAPIESVILVE